MNGNLYAIACGGSQFTSQTLFNFKNTNMDDEEFYQAFGSGISDQCLDNKLAWSIGLFSKFRVYKKCKLIDSAPNCIRILSAYWGQKHTIETIKQNCEIINETFTPDNVCQCLEGIGLNATKNRGGTGILDCIELPAILRWQNNQYVILYNIGYNILGHMVLDIADPTTKKRTCRVRDIERLWCDENKRGLAITISPTYEFNCNIPKKQNIFRTLLNKFTPTPK